MEKAFPFLLTFWLFLSLFIFAHFFRAFLHPPKPSTVLKVIDGDTILIQIGGKDIGKYPGNQKTQLYVERLRDYYQDGLFAKPTEEDSIRKLKIKNLVRICFTELRLSQSERHADRYGKLGIGFLRDFIMNKGGRPVIYIPFEAEITLLEDCIRNAYEKSEGLNDIHKPLKWLFTFVKRMWDGKGQDFYDEMEWRLVHDESSDGKIFIEGKEKGTFRFKFVASDVRVIIFPDEMTKQMAVADRFISVFLQQYAPI